jgi:hypothetical protein
MQAATLCSQPINPKLLKLITKKLNGALAALGKAEAASKPKKASKLAANARKNLNTIESKAAKFVTVKKNPISAVCRDQIDGAVTPTLQAIAAGRL